MAVRMIAVDEESSRVAPTPRFVRARSYLRGVDQALSARRRRRRQRR